MLLADHISFGYGPSLVVHDVSLHAPRGALIGVLGPNGSGKTTLLKLLSGGLHVRTGSITLEGRPLGSMPRRALAQRVAVVAQETHLAFDYSVLEIVLMGRYPRLGAFEIESPDDVASALRALARTGTEALASRAFPTLSGGEKQRVIIASALAQLDERGSKDDSGATPSKLLFLDEPTASLDLKYQLEVGRLIRALHADDGITVILSTHDLRFAASVCQHIVMFADGRVLAEGAPRDVLTPMLVGALYDIGAEAAAPILA